MAILNVTKSLLAVVGKLLLKSSGVTIVPLIVKVTRTYAPLPIFHDNYSVTVTSYWHFKCSNIAEPLFRYFEDQEELLLCLKKKATTANPSRKLKTTPKLFCY
jgi:hypothetical protein